MKWYDQILNSAKSYFELKTDATEQEVHEAFQKKLSEALQGHKSLDDFKASLRSDLETEIKAEMQSKIDEDQTEFLKKTQDFESALEAANQKAAQLSTEAQNLRTEVEQLKRDVETKAEEIKTLKAKPKVELELGATGGEQNQNGGEMPVWEAFKSQFANLRK